MENSVAVLEVKALPTLQSQALAVEEITGQVQLIQQVMAKVMKEGEHYGTIPGCGNKPTLFKPGAEKLVMTFRLAPRYDIQERDMPNGHREYRVICSLQHIPTGTFFGEGVGVGTTMEGKYRFRAGGGEVTEVAVPKSYWDVRREDQAEAAKILRETANKAGLEGTKFGTKKDDAGVWRVTTFGDRVEHDNPADYYNTVLKMAKKRALVDAALTSTAASDIFAQDLEDLPEHEKKAATSRSATPMDDLPPEFGQPAPKQAPKPKKHESIDLEALGKWAVGFTDPESMWEAFKPQQTRVDAAPNSQEAYQILYDREAEMNKVEA